MRIVVGKPCFTVPADCEGPVRAELAMLGINEELLFPGLDGAARYLAWKAAAKEW